VSVPTVVGPFAREFRLVPPPQPLLVVVVQPDRAIGSTIACAVASCGHRVMSVPAASWAVPLVRCDLPDVLVVDRAAYGYGRLMAELDVLPVPVSLVVTRFAPARCSARFIRDAAAEIVRRVETISRSGGAERCRPVR
jgi:hypothetical protein